MAADIKRALGVEAELVEGSNGIFDVVVDGAVIFSKYDVHRFPEPDEIVGALRERS